MAKKNEVELWMTIQERLSPQDLETLISLSNDYNHRRIGYAQLITSAMVLFKNDGFLHRCFIDLLQEDKDGETQNDEGEVRETEACVRNNESTRDRKESERRVEEATAMAYDVGQEDVAICEMVDKIISEKVICPSELQKLISLVQDKQKISHSEFRESLLLLLKNTIVEDTDLGEGNGETQDDEFAEVEADLQIGVQQVGENAREEPPVHGEPKIEDDLEKRVKEDKDKKEDVKEEPEQVVNPSYTLIPEEERSPVSGMVLNNEYRLVKVKTTSPQKLTGYRKQAAEYEDDMYREDMVIEDLTSAVELWEKVMRREVRIEDVEDKFYTCIRELDRGALVKKLRQNYRVALPRILDRLKAKLCNLRKTQEKKKSRWKQIESNARKRGKKVKENNNLNHLDGEKMQKG